MWYIPLIMALLAEFWADGGKGISTWTKFLVVILGSGFISLFLAILVGVLYPELAVTIETYEAIAFYFVMAFVGLATAKVARVLGGIELAKR